MKVTAILAAFLVIPIAALAQTDPLDAFVAENLKSTSTYVSDASEYMQKQRSKTPMTDDERVRYSKAYTYYAWKYYKGNDAAKSVKAILLALKLHPGNPTALYVAGDFSMKKSDYANATSYFKNATKLGGDSIGRNSTGRLNGIASDLLEQATQLAEKQKFIEANKRLAFIANRFQGKWHKQAMKLGKSYQDEITAAKMLQRAQQSLRMRRRGDAQRLLKEITTKYSWTHASEEAQKILRQSDDLFVKAEEDSVFSEVAAMKKWKVLETENFVIYYRNNDFAKEAAKIIEEVFAKVTEELDLKKVRWNHSKCKIFLFDNNDTWTKFKEESGGPSEWATAFASRNSREIFGNASQGKELLYSTLPHELTHLIHYDYLGRKNTLPVWLAEGLAMHQQFDSKLFYYRRVEGAIKFDGIIPLIPLDELVSYKKYPIKEKVPSFYAQSMALVEFIIEKAGHDTFARLNRDIKRGKGEDLDFKKLCKRYLKSKPDVIENAWKQFVSDKVKSLESK